jgi:hypothetical protein
MLSNARIYVFDISYNNSVLLSELQINQLAGTVSHLLSTGVNYLTFKNLNFINLCEVKKDSIRYTSQLHIEKIVYKENKILSKQFMAELRSQIRGQLKKISLFKFGQILIVNDEFDFKSTSAFFNNTEDLENSEPLWS